MLVDPSGDWYHSFEKMNVSIQWSIDKTIKQRD
jgi:hypothetical protein